MLNYNAKRSLTYTESWGFFQEVSDMNNKKRLALALILSIILTCITSCAIFSKNGGKNYPEGSIALTEDNFSDYFEIKTTATCDYNFYTETTDAAAYVAIVPLQSYKEVAGEIKFDVNTRVYKWYGNESFKISHKEESLLLGKDIVNDTYKLSIQKSNISDPYDDPFKVDSESVGISVNSVYGYLIIDDEAKQPNEMEALTKEQRDASDSVYAEVEALLDELKHAFNSAESYTYQISQGYEIKSYYGDALSQKSSLTPYTLKVNKSDNLFEYLNRKHYSIDGDWYEQSIKHGSNLIDVSPSGFSMDSICEECAPVWDMLDANAIYIKEQDGTYSAYVSLYDMTNNKWNENIRSYFNTYGMTTRYDKFVVKYKYYFTNIGLDFYISIDYDDYSYPTNRYCGAQYNANQTIMNINNTKVELYSEDTHDFALADNFEDASFFKHGLVEIDGSTTELSYTTFSDQYKDEINPPYQNYLPVKILESGVYNFTPDKHTIHILDESGMVYGYYDDNNYFPAGLYYIRSNYVHYGTTRITVSVESRIYNDYADIHSPDTTLRENDSFEFEFEGNGDRNAFLFTPDHSGIYALGNHDNVNVLVYDKANLDEYESSIWPSNLNVELIGAKEYVIVLECVNYGDNTDHFTYSGKIEYIGQPTGENAPIGYEWTEVVLSGSCFFTVTPENVGFYYVEYEYECGKEIINSYVRNLNGSAHYEYKLVEIGGKEVRVYALNKDTVYTLHPSVNTNEYFKGKARLVCYEAGITESESITVPTSEYITITTSDLNTPYSSSTYTFTVTEKCRLLITVDSDSFALYDEKGRRYMFTVYPTYEDEEFGVEAEYVKDLQPGTYNIVFLVEDIDGKTGERTITVRLLTE